MPDNLAEKLKPLEFAPEGVWSYAHTSHGVYRLRDDYSEFTLVFPSGGYVRRNSLEAAKLAAWEHHVETIRGAFLEGVWV